MGKKSLLKSTAKKGGKSQTPQAKDDSVKTEGKEATGSKAAAKTKAPSKKQVPAAEPPTRESLIQKKFDVWEPKQRFEPPLDAGHASRFSAPPFWSESADLEKFHPLLFRKYSPADLKVAAEKAEAEAKAKAEAEAKAKAEAEAKAKAEAEAKAKAEAEAKAKAEAEAKAKAEAEAKAKAEAEAKAKAEAEAKAKAEAEAKAKAEAEAKAKAEAEAKAKAAAPAPGKAAVSPESAVATPKAAREGDGAMNKMVFTLAACVVGIVIPIIIASFMNSMNYSLKKVDGALELWQGSFAPVGEYRMVTMPGAVLPEPAKESYTKMEAYPLVCQYYLEKADAIEDATSIPDFERIRSDLDQARTYAITQPLREAVYARFVRIDFILLVYKADVAAGLNTKEGYAEAIAYLESAAGLEIGEAEAEMVKRKIEKYTASLAAARPEAQQQ